MTDGNVAKSEPTEPIHTWKQHSEKTKALEPLISKEHLQIEGARICFEGVKIVSYN